MSKVSSRTYQVSGRMGLIFGVVVSSSKELHTCATEKWAITEPMEPSLRNV